MLHTSYFTFHTSLLGYERRVLYVGLQIELRGNVATTADV